MRNVTLSSARALTLGVLALGSTLAGSSAGCSSSESSAGGDSSCVSTREYFTTRVYGKAMQTCVGCHSPGGLADNAGAKFRMYRETTPDFVSANINAIKQYAEIEVRDTPLILVKPLGQREHGGGAVLVKGSEDYKILEQFVTDLRAGVDKTCDAGDQLAVDYLDNQAVARKAAVSVGGFYPTEAQFEQVKSDEGLDAFLLDVTRTELFYDRLREIWNDALLT
jgi:hypothetical protein